MRFLFFAGFPNYDYSGDDYNYNDNQYTDNEPIENPEEEIKYDIKFLNIGGSQIVDKGTTIKLPCIVDKYPGMLQFKSVYLK